MKTKILSAVIFTLLPGRAISFQPSPESKNAANQITESAVRGHVRFLASDLLEGRGPASRGDELARAYIASQFEAAGLLPGAEDGTWFQTFGIVGVTAEVPKSIRFNTPGGKVSLKYLDDFQLYSGVQKPTVETNDAELVFVGYGMVAPEYQWDDYKDVDVRGKLLVFMNNDPAGDPNLFQGVRRLYYGRWDYKYEMAAKKGAAGAFIIHTNASAGYPWQVVQTSWTGEQFELPFEGGQVVPLKGWLTEDATRKIFTAAGINLDELRKQAETRDFRPVPLKTTLSISFKNKIRNAQTANVLGRLPGSDPRLSKEVVVYTAHHDHLGIKQERKPGEDRIFNGAVDNASGVAGILAISHAYTALKKPPRRSILFAAVGGEEAGLLGSEYFCRHPTVQSGRIAVDINVDGLGIFGKTSDLTYVGKGKTNLDLLIQSVLKMQRRVLKGDQFPDRGFFYRSDHFSFAKIGVPSITIEAGTEVIGKPKGWGKTQREKWEETTYHQPSDELKADWNLAGAIDDLRFGFYVGNEIANQSALPQWAKGDEFEAARKSALERIK